MFVASKSTRDVTFRRFKHTPLVHVVTDSCLGNLREDFNRLLRFEAFEVDRMQHFGISLLAAIFDDNITT